jgi:hypothetical protein
MPNMPATPKPLPELLSEVLSKPIPYKVQAEIPLNESFYLVCDYPFISKGTVLFCLRPGESHIQVHGFLPEASLAEKSALENLLARNTYGKASLNKEDLERSQLHLCTEEQGVARLMEIQKIIADRNNETERPKLH